MKRQLLIALVLGATVLTPAIAMAHTDLSIGVNLGGGYYQPAPVYEAPSATVYYAPRPVYEGRPVVYERTYYGHRDGWDHRWHDDDRRDRDHEWRHHERHDRDD